VSEIGRIATVSYLRFTVRYMLILLIDNKQQTLTEKKQLTFFAFGSPCPGNFQFFSSCSAQDFFHKDL